MFSWTQNRSNLPGWYGLGTALDEAAAEPGGPEVLQVQEVPDPVPDTGEVVIDVVATAVNRADLLQRAGDYPPPPGTSNVISSRFSGCAWKS